MTTGRRFHSDTRVSQNFTKDGLVDLTGQSSRKWGRYVVKELVDNALEAAEQADHDEPAVSVSLDVEGRGEHQYVRRVSVADNGPGFDRETLEQIADVTEFGGTKQHYALPTRGTQGNALMTVLGIQHFADGGPLTITSRGRTYEFALDADTIDGVPNVMVREQTNNDDRAVADGGALGTEITVELGDAGRGWGKSAPIMRTLFGFAALNPHVDLTVSVGDSYVTESGGERDTSEHYTPTAPGGSVHWFDRSAFEERLKADMRAAPDLTVGEFVGEFDGLVSRQKRRDVVDRLDADRDATLPDAYGDDGVLLTEVDNLGSQERMRIENLEKVAELHTAMQAETRKKSANNLDSTLGRIGEALRDGTKAYLDHYETAGADLTELATDLEDNGESVDGWRDLTVYYRTSDAVETDEHRFPFVFELAAAPLPADANIQTVHKFGINRSVAYSSPRVAVEFTDGNQNDRSHRQISSAFDDENHDFVVVSNLICPNIPFKDKGKQSFPTELFEDAVSDVVGKTIRKYHRDLRPMLNRLEKDDNTVKKPKSIPTPPRAPKGYIKRTVYDLFDDVYERATDGGTYTVTKRQLFYEMRPAFQKRADREGYKYTHDSDPHDKSELELNDSYFTETLIPNYETDEAGERLCHREQRGFFVEPHSNREIELSTRKVNKYDPTDALGTEFDTILFVEKRGFYELIHKEHEITKRFDIGLIQAQGYSTIAARRLVEKIKQADPDVEFLTLTDLDIHGLGIAADADAPDEFSTTESFDAERIGVTVGDVDRFDLQTERAGYNRDEHSKLETHYQNGDIDQATYEFLKDDKRVEINAIPPAELGDYLEAKLGDQGIGKITPDPDDVDTPDVDSWDKTRDKAVREAIGEFVVEEIDDELVDALAAADDRVSPPDESDRPTVDDGEASIQQAVCEELDDRPPESWEDVNEDVVEERKEEIEEAQDEFAENVDDAVQELLDEHDVVDVSPPDIDG